MNLDFCYDNMYVFDNINLDMNYGDTGCGVFQMGYIRL